MPVELVADESVDARLIRQLREAGFGVVAVGEDHKCLPDREVLAIAHQRHCVLVTEDNDFGEWVFAHHEPTSGIVFLRYAQSEREAMSRSIVELIKRQGQALFGKFTTITPRKTRMRDI